MAPEEQRPSLGRVAPLAEHRFSFVQDLAFDMAQFLVSKTTLKKLLKTVASHDQSKVAPILGVIRQFVQNDRTLALLMFPA